MAGQVKLKNLAKDLDKKEETTVQHADLPAAIRAKFAKEQ